MNGRNARFAKITAAALTGLALVLAVAAAPAEAVANRRGKPLPAPQLFEPGETVDPSAAPAVRFRWSPDRMRGDHHRHDEFRLFRGNQAFADALIRGAEVPPGQGQIQIPSEFVREPGTYCWTVRRVGVQSRTREAFSVFKVGATT